MALSLKMPKVMSFGGWRTARMLQHDMEERAIAAVFGADLT
jgi:hypothetical protein